MRDRKTNHPRTNRFIAASMAFLLCLSIAPFARTAILEDITVLTDPSGDGGAQVTEQEVREFIGGVEDYSADQAVFGIAYLGTIPREDYESEQLYGLLMRSLRYRVSGLAITQNQAPGISFSLEQSNAPIEVSFDSEGISYRRVDIIYTADDWQTTRAETLWSENQSSIYRTVLRGAPETGILVYALHILATDGRDFWLNNPREIGIFKGHSFYNYALSLGALGAISDEPSRPAYVLLVRAFTDSGSPGGETVTNDEVSILVEEATFEGGSGLQEPSIIDPVLTEIDQMLAEGIIFEDNSDQTIKRFLQSQRWFESTWPIGQFSRTGTGELLLSNIVPQTPAIKRMKIFYSTDAWNSPMVTECFSGSTSYSPVCSLGYVPHRAMLAYSVELEDVYGQVTYQHTAGSDGIGRNFFHAIH